MYMKKLLKATLHWGSVSHQVGSPHHSTGSPEIVDHFKKIRDTKGIFHAKMVTVKDRNSMDLTEAEDIKKKWQEYTEELYKRDLNDPDNHDGVITHLAHTSWSAKSSRT